MHNLPVTRTHSSQLTVPQFTITQLGATPQQPWPWRSRGASERWLLNLVRCQTMPQILGTARVAHGNRHVPHALWVPPLQRLHEVRVTGHTRFQQRQVLRCTVLRQSVDNRHCHEVFVQITCRFRSAINKVLQWYKGIYVTETCRRELSNLNENSRIFCFKKFPCRFQDSQSVITSFSQCYMWLCTIIYHLRAVAWSRSFDTSRANSLYVNQDK